MSAIPYKKKLIEVALPLEDINREAAREKSIRHGHPSTLHLWRARRPLAACRAVLFAAMVDDPSESIPKLLAVRQKRKTAERTLRGKKKASAELKAIFTKSRGESVPTLATDVPADAAGLPAAARRGHPVWIRFSSRIKIGAER
jgi:adenine-specific DNA methylase